MPKVLQMSDAPGVFLIFCPACGCAHQFQADPYDGARWTFNGDFERPTIQPSLLVRWPHWVPAVTPENLAQFQVEPWEQHEETTICHSFIADGKIQFLADCTHAMAGQTVELPEI